MNRVSPELDSSPSALDQSIEAATRALLALQQRDGHWVFELEADATIPAEYVLLRHYLAEPVDAALGAKIAVYLRRVQGECAISARWVPGQDKGSGDVRGAGSGDRRVLRWGRQPLSPVLGRDERRA